MRLVSTDAAFQPWGGESLVRREQELVHFDTSDEGVGQEFVEFFEGSVHEEESRDLGKVCKSRFFFSEGILSEGLLLRGAVPVALFDPYRGSPPRRGVTFCLRLKK